MSDRKKHKEKDRAETQMQVRLSGKLKRLAKERAQVHGISLSSYIKILMERELIQIYPDEFKEVLEQDCSNCKDKKDCDIK